MMRSLRWRRIVVVVMGTLMSLMACGCSRIDTNAFRVSDRKVNVGELGQRTFLQPVGALKDDLAQVVGLILVVDETTRNQKAFDRRNTNPQFVVPREKVTVKATGEVRYDDKLNANAIVSAAFLSAILGELKASEVAEVTVTDVASVYTEKLSQETLRRLKLYQVPPGKTCFFISSAVLTTVTSRKFHEVQGNVTVSGVVFGADGKLYVSRDTHTNDLLLAVDLLDVSLLQMLSEVPPTGLHAVPSPTASEKELAFWAVMVASQKKAADLIPRPCVLNLDEKK